MIIKRSELRIRDPFILTDPKAGCYYMYGTIDLESDSYCTRPTFSVYKTYDLEHFEGPKVIFDGRKNNFWADEDFWAPEVHKYKGRYYLFGSCRTEGKCRATHIFVCDTPDGEFAPLSETPITPSHWECLDGTFFVEDGTPYMVFCHAWTQVKDGEICAVALSEDLSRPVGDPFLLFRASEHPDVGELRPGTGNYVTDGPFLYREEGKVKMIWSSFFEGRYLVLGSESLSLRGPWTHTGNLFHFDGGHAMLFSTLEGKRMIALHKPNKTNFERAAFYEFCN